MHKIMDGIMIMFLIVIYNLGYFVGWFWVLIILYLFGSYESEDE